MITDTLRVLTFDTETLRWFNEVEREWKNIKSFGLAVLAFHTSWDDERYLYIPHQYAAGIDDTINPGILNVGIHDAIALFGGADRIVSFNAEGFDFQVMASAGFNTESWQIKSYDILAKFVQAAGHRITLNSLAQNLIDESKILDGEKAVSFWRAAQLLTCGWSAEADAKYNRTFHADAADEHLMNASDWLFNQVYRYCLHDVHLTQKCYENIDFNSGLVRISTAPKGVPRPNAQFPDRMFRLDIK